MAQPEADVLQNVMLYSTLVAGNLCAGHVNPPAMFNPGLVFDSSYEDWGMSLCFGNIADRLSRAMFNRCGQAFIMMLTYVHLPTG
jgi:hypothetical protein